MISPLVAALMVVLEPASVAHTFTYEASSDLKSVSVAGTFNGWDMGANPLKQVGNRQWSGTVTIQPGRHQYKFVLDGSNWITDPKSMEAKLAEKPKIHMKAYKLADEDLKSLVAYMQSLK